MCKHEGTFCSMCDRDFDQAVAEAERRGAEKGRAHVVAFLQECPVAAASPAEEAVFRMALRAAAVMIQEGVHTKDWARNAESEER